MTKKEFLKALQNRELPAIPADYNLASPAGNQLHRRAAGKAWNGTAPPPGPSLIGVVDEYGVRFFGGPVGAATILRDPGIIISEDPILLCAAASRQFAPPLELLAAIVQVSPDLRGSTITVADRLYCNELDDPMAESISESEAQTIIDMNALARDWRISLANAIRGRSSGPALRCHKALHPIIAGFDTPTLSPALRTYVTMYIIK
ncbi:hypothetical protein DFH09DRAFT_1076385 [Mycena vulgaris]|nr:hypothetical protein DFH09DRAFT_1076385 [Mycena vulgaris]